MTDQENSLPPLDEVNKTFLESYDKMTQQRLLIERFTEIFNNIKPETGDERVDVDIMEIQRFLIDIEDLYIELQEKSYQLSNHLMTMYQYFSEYKQEVKDNPVVDCGPGCSSTKTFPPF